MYVILQYVMLEGKLSVGQELNIENFSFSLFFLYFN